MRIIYCMLVYAERNVLKNAFPILKCKVGIDSWNKVIICYQLQIREKMRGYHFLTYLSRVLAPNVIFWSL